MKWLLSLSFMVLSFSGLAQKEANIWHFGNNAGMDFNSGAPVAISGSALATMEGCASIADETGVLRFYTDGITVWNNTHNPMPDGFGLMGSGSSTQSGVIVPQPGSDDFYYVFTVMQLGLADGFRYSIVDMTLDGGLGDIVPGTKNTPILTPTSEKITAAANGVNDNIWVLTHKWGTDEFYAYEVTPTGFVSTPVISAVGIVHTGTINYTLGQMKISPDGSNLALATYSNAVNQLFDFDNVTGVVSNPITLTATPYDYGVEFSPDGSKLYIAQADLPPGGPFELNQWDISSGVPVTIAASKTLFLSSLQTDN